MHVSASLLLLLSIATAGAQLSADAEERRSLPLGLDLYMPVPEDNAWRDGTWRDLGRLAVTGKEADRGAFKTPTLREIARTAPYMHDGSVTTLDEVIEYYDRGGNPNTFRDPELRPLALTTDEKRALVAFLGSLSGEVHEGPDSRRVR